MQTQAIIKTAAQACADGLVACRDGKLTTACSRLADISQAHAALHPRSLAASDAAYALWQILSQAIDEAFPAQVAA